MSAAPMFRYAPGCAPDAQCACLTGKEWAGSPCENDTAWECDDCGRIIPCEGASA